MPPSKAALDGFGQLAPDTLRLEWASLQQCRQSMIDARSTLLDFQDGLLKIHGQVSDEQRTLQRERSRYAEEREQLDDLNKKLALAKREIPPAWGFPRVE